MPDINKKTPPYSLQDIIDGLKQADWQESEGGGKHITISEELVNNIIDSLEFELYYGKEKE